MARKTSSFARGRAKFKPQPRVLILCEDKKSCRTYLSEGAQHFRCHADVEIAHVGKTDPRNIVAEAKTRHSDYDLVFCSRYLRVSLRFAPCSPSQTEARRLAGTYSASP